LILGVIVYSPISFAADAENLCIGTFRGNSVVAYLCTNELVDGQHVIKVGPANGVNQGICHYDIERVIVVGFDGWLFHFSHQESGPDNGCITGTFGVKISQVTVIGKP